VIHQKMIFKNYFGAILTMIIFCSAWISARQKWSIFFFA